MFLSVGALLSILSLAYSQSFNESTTLPSCCCDDDLLKTITNKMGMLETSNENLHLKIDKLKKTVKSEFTKLKADTTGRAAGKQTKASLDKESIDSSTTSYENLIDVPESFDEPQNNTYRPATASGIKIPSSCSEALRQSGRQSGLHQIRIPGSDLLPFFVYCLADPEGDGGAWTVIQRRIDGSIDFYRPWSEYQQGFGNLEGEFFLGLDKIHALTHSSLHELWIQMADFENNTRWAKYSTFAIGDASDSFALNVLGSYTGDAGDSLTPHAGMKFTTKDRDNDWYEYDNCAKMYQGAWWYKNCHVSNFNGRYLHGAYPKEKFGQGMDWKSWHGHYYSLKNDTMAIRSKSP